MMIDEQPQAEAAVKIFEIKDRTGREIDFIAAHDAESALGYFAIEFHGYDSVRTCRVDNMIDDDSPREITEAELDELERIPDADQLDSDNSDKAISFRKALAEDLAEGMKPPFYFSSCLA